MIDPARVCVVSGGDEVRYRSYVNHTVFAREHGFTHHIGIGLAPGIATVYHYKFEVVREVLPHVDWVLYVDDDVYVTDFGSQAIEEHLADAEARDLFLVIAEGPVETDGVWTKVNSGVMLLRNDPRAFAFLDAAQTRDLAAIEADWSPQDEGLYTFGDQDAIWRVIRDDPQVAAGTAVVGHRVLNSREHYYGDDPTDAFAVHFCGPGDKPLRVAVFGRRFGWGQELVPDDLLDRYSVRRRERMGDPEIAARRARLVGRAGAKRVRRKVEFVRCKVFGVLAERCGLRALVGGAGAC